MSYELYIFINIIYFILIFALLHIIFYCYALNLSNYANYAILIMAIFIFIPLLRPTLYCPFSFFFYLFYYI